MEYLLTISYHNEKVAEATYQNLHNTMKNKPCKVLLLDNNCPLMRDKNFLKDLCTRLGFEYHNAGSNLGLHDGYNYLITKLPKGATRFILFDGDSYPVTPDWHIPLLKLLDDPSVVWGSLYNQISYREMSERGGNKSVVSGYKVTIPTGAVMNSVSSFSIEWINSVHGFTEPNKFYGGLEVHMWAKIPKGKKWIFLDDYAETINPIEPDPIYTQYKWAHAHEGQTELSLEEFISNVDRAERQAKLFSETDHSISKEILGDIATRIPTMHQHTHVVLDLVKTIEKPEVIYLEIGVYNGATSSLALTDHRVEAYGIDLGWPVTPATARMHVLENRVDSKFKYIMGDSHNPNVLEAVKHLKGKVDVLLIDGDHSAAGTLQDFKMYSPLVDMGGYIVFDDYQDYKYSPEVKSAVDKIVAEMDKKYRVIGCIENTGAYFSYEIPRNNCFILQRIR